MKVIVYDRYGPPEVLRVGEAPEPVPKDNEILIKIRATTVTSGDWRLRSMNVPTGFKLISRLIFGVLRPRRRVLGMELSGIVEAVGKDVTAFEAGNAVFGFDSKGMGCYAEYKCMPENGPVAAKPDSLTFEEAAALSFGGTTALYFLRKARLQSGQKVLPNGASGGVGTALVQLAKHFGAEVTGVCSGANAEMVKSLGADRVIDYTKEDFTKNGETYDVIVDTAGTAPYARSKGSLKAGGCLVLVQSGLPEMLTAPWISLTGNKKVIAGPATEKPEDVRFLAKLAETGRFNPVIDRRYRFDRIIEAHRYVDTGHKRGNVVVTLEHDEPEGSSSTCRQEIPAMNIEYIDDPQDGSVILIYGRDTTAIGRLVEAFGRMADGTSTGCDVHEILNVSSEVHLLASVSKRNIGVVQESPTAFQWKLTAAMWDNVTGLLEPFTWPSTFEKGHGHQYLNNVGSDMTEVIVSTDRSW